MFYTPLAAFAVGILVLLVKGFGTLRRSMWTYIFLCLTLVMLALGVISERAYSMQVTVGFIIATMAVYEVLKRFLWARIAVTSAVLALNVYAAHRVLPSVWDYKAYEDGIVNELVAAPRQAVLRERRFLDYSRFVFPLRFVSSEWFLREDVYCDYYGKDNVQFVCDSVYDRYHAGRLLEGAVELNVECDRPDIVSSVLTFHDQPYMAVSLKVDSLPVTSQQTEYILSPTEGLSPAELEYRRNYGLYTDRTPHGFYPLRYQGRLLLIFPSLEDNVERIEFPIDRLEPPTLVTLKVK